MNSAAADFMSAEGYEETNDQHKEKEETNSASAETAKS
jgi:hypothetical protein